MDALVPRSALLLVASIAMGALALLVFALSQFLAGLYALGIVSLGISFVLLALLAQYRRGDSQVRIAHLFILVAFIGQVLGAIFSGGIFSFTLPSLALFPLFAFVLLGTVGGAGWAIITLATISALYVTQVLDLAPSVPTSMTDQPGQALANLAVLMVYGFGLVYWQHRTNQLQQEALEVATEAADAASAAKTRFLANMSHELRTPMHAIIGLTELTLTRKQLDHTDENALSTVLRSGRAMVLLLDDLLDLSRVEAGGIELESVTLHPAEVLNEVFELLSEHALEKRVALVAEINDDVSYGTGDPGRLGQVLVNLVGNAVKFTTDGTVTVRMGRRGDSLTVEVEDDGVGIRPEALKRIFQPFIQADSSTTRKFGGTGLGLTISTNLVQCMGGELTARSTEGVGSVFYFHIQLPACPAPESGDSDHPPLPVRPLSVLVAEDNAINREVVRRQLELMQIQVTLAQDGHQALQALTEKSFDMVFMDLHMPGLDGLDTTRQARIRGYTGPIVAMTASALPEDREAAEQAGMNDFIVKPVTMDDLSSLFVVQQSQQEAELGG